MSDYQHGDDEWSEEQSLEEMPLTEAVGFIADFMSGGIDAETMYRDNYCTMAASKAFYEFGQEGLCQLMIAIDERANWITDILVDASDIDNILFRKYGIFGGDVMSKARQTNAMSKMNQEMWALRRKYAKKIAEEIYAEGGKWEPRSTDKE